jgi:tetratricopeptide (TPR) repeat protein
VIKKSEIAPAEWNAFRQLGRSLYDDEFTFMRLRDGGAAGSTDIANTRELDRKFREGYAALQRGDALRARELFEQVIAGDPKYSGAHFNMALALLGQNRFNDALLEFRREEEIAPEDARPYQAAATFLTRLHRRADAAQEWRKLLKVDPKNRDAALTLSQLLSADAKFSEAAEVLEKALTSAPDSPSLQFALGMAYVKNGQGEKAASLLRAGAEAKGSADAVNPTMLNDAAYALAESISQLDLAKQFAEKAVADLELKSASSAPDQAGLEITYQLALTWDTLGWVFFQTGDLNRAESYIRASWILAQQAVVGDHLGQIYEKQGKKAAAVHLYELALETSSLRMVPAVSNAIFPATADTSKLTDILARYEKLTGRKKPTIITKRLPSGEWSLTPAEELSRARRTDITKPAGLSGSADFLIIFGPGKVESLQYVSGDKSVESLTDKLLAAKYRVEFPTGSKAKLVRRLSVSCQSVCSAVLLPLDQAMLPQF